MTTVREVVTRRAGAHLEAVTDPDTYLSSADSRWLTAALAQAMVNSDPASDHGPAVSVAANPASPPQVLDQLIDHPSTYVRQEALSNPSSPWESCRDAGLEWAVHHPACPPDLLTEFTRTHLPQAVRADPAAQSPHGWTPTGRPHHGWTAALAHPNLPAAERQALTAQLSGAELWPLLRNRSLAHTEALDILTRPHSDSSQRRRAGLGAQPERRPAVAGQPGRRLESRAVAAAVRGRKPGCPAGGARLAVAHRQRPRLGAEAETVEQVVTGTADQLFRVVIDGDLNLFPPGQVASSRWLSSPLEPSAAASGPPVLVATTALLDLLI